MQEEGQRSKADGCPATVRHIQGSSRGSGGGCMFFFFSSRRRHTRLQGDWSSDVCSSDLLEIGCEEIPASWLPGLTNQVGEVLAAQLRERRLGPETPVETYSTPRRLTVRKIGRASCRERV